MSVSTVAVEGFGRALVVLWVVGVSGPVDFSIETVLLVGCVMDLPDGSVGFLQLVESLDDVAVPRLVLALDVVGMWVVNAVFELVFGVVVL